MGLSTELPSARQLALPERAGMRAGRDHKAQKRPVSRNAREEKGSREREQSDEDQEVSTECDIKAASVQCRPN